MLKSVVRAMLVSGLLLGSSIASAKYAYPAQWDGVDYGVVSAKADSDGPFPDQSDAVDYGIRLSKADNDSPFPDQSDSTDYGVHQTA